MKNFLSAVKSSDFTLTAQLQLNQDMTVADVVGQAKQLSGFVDAVVVPANAGGAVHMAGLAVASLLLDKGIDPVLHMASRDRNQIALRSELLGAAALGVTSIVIQRGDKLPEGFVPRSKEVFEYGAKKLLTIAGQLNAFLKQRGENQINLGAVASIFEPAENWQPEELQAKADAGAQFIQTQVCADLDILRHYMKALVSSQFTHRCHMVMSLPVLQSAEAARWMQKNIRGASIPSSVVDTLSAAEDPQRTGIELCVRWLQEAREIPGIGGVNLQTTGKAENLMAVIETAKLPR